MYNIIKNVIQSKGYELADMLRKIDTLWVKGSITEEEREELISFAQGNAQTGNSVDLIRKLEELDKRVSVVEKSLLQSGEEDTEEPAEPIIYPEFVQDKWYYRGNKVSFEGAVYECIAPENVVCVWSPSVYPTYWQRCDSGAEEIAEAVEETTE